MAIWTRFNIVTSQWIFRVPHLAIYRSSGSCDEQVLTITPSNVVNPMINLPFGGGYHPFMVILGMVGFTTLRTISPKKAGRGRSVKTPPHKLSDVRYPSQMLQICTNIYATIIKCIFSYFIYIWVNFGKHIHDPCFFMRPLNTLLWFCIGPSLIWAWSMTTQQVSNLSIQQ